MSDLFTKRITLFCVQLLVLTGCLFLLHTHLLSSFVAEISLVLPLWKIYVFHGITVFIVFFIINYRYSIGNTTVFNAFILLMIAKMIFVIIFLLPLFFSNSSHKIIEATNFFIPYFLFLAFEVYSINKFLTNK